MEVLNSIPIELELEAVIKRMRLRKRNDNILGNIREMLDIAVPIARPKAVYEVSYVENKNEDSLQIGGVTFTSRVLRVNLDKVERVFPCSSCECRGRVDGEFTMKRLDFRLCEITLNSKSKKRYHDSRNSQF